MELANAKSIPDSETSKVVYESEKMNEEQNKNTEQEKLLRLKTGYSQHASLCGTCFKGICLSRMRDRSFGVCSKS
jgi:hypothetical protein